MLRRSKNSVLVLAALVPLAWLAVASVTTVAEAQTRYPVNITSTPVGATVFLDTTSSPALGVTPLRSVRVARGQHNFIFRMEGYQETTLAVSVTRYGQAVAGVLPQMARLQITAADSSATGATVTIDGAPAGPIPYSAYIRPDRVQIVVTREGYNPSEQWVTLSAGQVYAWPVTLQRNAPRVGSLAVFADLRGAPVFVDGTQRGTTPTTLNDIPEGPHLVEIRPTQEGARPFTQQVTIVAGQTATVDAHIEVASTTGTLRVISATAGAIVSVDGDVVGPSPATRELQAGEHIIEVNAAGFQRSQQTVTIVAGQARNIQVDLTAAAATAGTIRVIGAPRGATVTVDGDAIGELPAERGGFTPGDHVVEVSMTGYVSLTRTVTVTAGQTNLVNVELQQRQGRMVIRANVAGATVIIDGADPRPLPYVQDTPPVGSHAIIIRAPGYAEFSQTCQIGPGQDCNIEANLQGARIGLRVSVQAGVSARLYIDGVEAGPTPYTGDVGIGEHILELRAPNYRNNSQTVSFSDHDAPHVLDVHMMGTNELTPEEVAQHEANRERRIRRSFGHTAATIPADLATVEIATGFPFIAGVRFNMGVHDNVDIGMSVRDAGRLVEFLGHVRAGYAVSPRFSVGGELTLGGGVIVGNTHHSNALTGNNATSNAVNFGFDARASLHVNRAAALTANVGVEVTSDRYDYFLGDSSGAYTADPGRQTNARGRVGLALDLALSNHDSLTFWAQAVLGEPRRVLGDMFGIDSISYETSNLMHADLRFSWTHKFNWRFDDSLD